MSTADTTPYNMNEAARALQKSTSTISYWLTKGELFEVPSHGRQRLISAESIQRKARQLGIELREAVS